VLEDTLDHLVRGIVRYPDKVRVSARITPHGKLLLIHANDADVGKIIGRSGNTITAIRTIITALAGDESVRVDIYSKPPSRSPSRR
jgi:predicted RNA-binding protein YlqC (UPF0109 family)